MSLSRGRLERHAVIKRRLRRRMPARASWWRRLLCGFGGHRSIASSSQTLGRLICRACGTRI